MPLTVTVVQKEENVYAVSAFGSLDSNTYSTLEQKVQPLLSSPIKALVLDMTHISYISSMGVSVILRIKKTVEEMKGNFLMTNLQPQIKMVFEIIKALPQVGIFESTQEADRYLAEMQRRAMEKKDEDY